MDHYHRAHLPRNREEAVRWAERDTSAGYKLAALFNKLRLGAEETGILIFGCTWGLPALMASRVVRALGPNPANVVGVDTCRPLLDLAETALDLEAEGVAGVRNLVSFVEMDVRRIRDEANTNRIQSMFPRGISTIIAMEMFRDLSNNHVRLVARDLMALLLPGGRLVIDVYEESLDWGIAHVVSRPFVPPRLVGITNIVSPRTIMEVQEETRTACDNVSGTTPSGTEVQIRHTECIQLYEVWDRFSRVPSNPVGRGHAPIRPWTAGDNDYNILICDEATFNPGRNQFYRTSEYSVQHANGFGNFAHCLLQMLATCYQREEQVDRQRAISAICEQTVNGHLMQRMETLLRRYRGDLFEDLDHVQGTGLRRAAAEIFNNEHDACRITGLPTMQSTTVSFSPASLLVILRRD